jgi:histidine triad (HIT) family protein
VSECLFCGIIAGKVKGEIVHRDEKIVVIKDINPQAPVHLLIIPRKHIATSLEIIEEDKDLVGQIFLVANQLAKVHGIAQDGFRVVINCGPEAGQSVYHIHFHLLGGRVLRWPPG